MRRGSLRCMNIDKLSSAYDSVKRYEALPNQDWRAVGKSEAYVKWRATALVRSQREYQVMKR